MTRALPPGPRSRLPGGLLLRFRRDPIAFLGRLAAEHGPIARFTVGPQAIYVLNHPDLVRELLVTQQKHFVKGGALVRAKRFLGEGLLTSEDPEHLRQRRLVQPAFHRARIAAFGDVMSGYTAAMRDRWVDGAEVDVWREMMHVTLAIVGKTLFSADIEGEAADVERAIEDLMAVFDTVMLPFSGLLQALPTATNRRASRALARLDALVYRLVAERRASGEDPGDLLSMLMAAQDEESGGTRMEARQIRDEAMTLLLAGHETTANALTWTWYLLDRHPEAAVALHAELDSVLAGRLPTMADLPRLPVTEAVFSESMRLFPPGWATGRRAASEAVIGGHRIPKGALVLVSQYWMHRHPDYWPEPEAFDLSRWTPEAKASRPQFAYFPFGGGPRGCIGEPFAWMEGVLVLATLASAWSLSRVESAPAVPLPLVTLRPRDGMRMVARRRSPTP